MRFLGNAFLVTILVAGMGASYHFLYRPKSACAGHVHALQQRVRALSGTDLRGMVAANGTDRAVLLDQQVNFIGPAPLPSCPDGGRYLITFRVPRENARATEMPFHVNCTHHRFRTGR